VDPQPATSTQNLKFEAFGPNPSSYALHLKPYVLDREPGTPNVRQHRTIGLSYELIAPDV